MRDEKHLQQLYQNNPHEPPKRVPVEEEVERYYTLLRLKLSPDRLKKISIFHIGLLGGLIVLLFIAALLLPKPTESVLEKRKLTEKPSFTAQTLFSGSYSRQVETYFADTFPGREFLVGLSAVADESRGVRFDDVRIVSPTNEAPPAAQPITNNTTSTDPPQSLSENSEQAVVPAPSSSGQESSGDVSSSETVAPEGAVNVSNGTFVYNGMAMSLFGGSPSSADWYADVISGYQQELPNVKVYNMIIPTAIEFYVPDKYRDMTGSQKAIIDRIYERLDPSVKRVDAYSELAAHKDEYLYFRTDHHWTGLGAYYAYVAFCRQAGFAPVSLANTDTRRLDNFIGTMYSQTQDSTLLKNPDYVDYYVFPQQHTALRYDKSAPFSAIPHTLWGEYAKSPNSYSVFLHGDFPLISVKTGIANGRKVMLVKESFGNAFAPFLINHYEEVYIVDQRYFELSAIDLIQKNGINELIFANNSFAACTPYHIQCIQNLRYYRYTPPQAKEEEPPQDEAAEEEATTAMANPDRKIIKSQTPNRERSSNTPKSASSAKSQSSSSASSEAQKQSSSAASREESELPSD